jgi:hypothetical protein
MDQPHDTFAAFLAVLSEAMDEHDASGAAASSRWRSRRATRPTRRSPALSAGRTAPDYDFSVERGEAVTGMRKRLDEVGPAFAAQVADICRQDRLDEMLVCPGENAVEEGRFQS